MPEELDAQVAGVGRAQDAGDNLPLSKGQAVGIHSGRLAGAALDVVEALGGHCLLSLLLEAIGIGGHEW